MYGAWLLRSLFVEQSNREYTNKRPGSFTDDGISNASRFSQLRIYRWRTLMISIIGTYERL